MQFPSFLSLQKQSSKTVAIFDVASGSVGVAISNLGPRQHPVLYYQKRLQVAFQKQYNTKTLTKAMLSTFLDAVLQLQSEGMASLKAAGRGKPIDTILCVYHPPWSLAKIRTVSTIKEDPWQVTENLVDDSVGAEVRTFTEEAGKVLEGKGQASPVIIEQKILQTILNGYPTANPIGQKVKTMDISLIVSALSSGLHKKTKDTLDQLPSVENIHTHTFATASFSSLRDTYHNTESFLVVDVNAEVTTISLISNSSFKAVHAFDVGHHAVIRAVALKLNTIVEEVPTLLRNFREGKLNESESGKVSSALEHATKIWLDSFKRNLATLSKGTILPNTVFIISSSDHTELFRKIITNSDFSQLTFSQASFNVVPISSLFLSGYVDAPNIQEALDPFLALETVFFNKLLHQV